MIFGYCDGRVWQAEKLHETTNVKPVSGMKEITVRNTSIEWVDPTTCSDGNMIKLETLPEQPPEHDDEDHIVALFSGRDKPKAGIVTSHPAYAEMLARVRAPGCNFTVSLHLVSWRLLM